MVSASIEYMDCKILLNQRHTAGSMKVTTRMASAGTMPAAGANEGGAGGGAASALAGGAALGRTGVEGVMFRTPAFCFCDRLEFGSLDNNNRAANMDGWKPGHVL